MFACANPSSNHYATDPPPIDVRSAIRLYVEPLLKKNNFIFSHSENSEHIFRHLKNSKLIISFTVKPVDKCIRCDLKRGNKKDLIANYPLSMFINGTSCVNVTKSDGFWHYHSHEELIAVLEEQTELLDKYGFQWMFDRLNMELEEC